MFKQLSFFHGFGFLFEFKVYINNKTIYGRCDENNKKDNSLLRKFKFNRACRQRVIKPKSLPHRWYISLFERGCGCRETEEERSVTHDFP